MQVADVWELFKGNWVFELYWWHNPQFSPPDSKNAGVLPKIYYAIRSSYLLTIISVGLLIFFSGAAGALLAGDLLAYFKSLPPYLNSVGIALGFLAFAWFTNVFPSMIAYLSKLIAVDDEDYQAIVSKWVGRFGANYYLIIPLSLIVGLLNLFEVWQIWTWPNPPEVFAPWLASPARQYFALYYMVVHAILIPFILASGFFGVVGTMFMLWDLLQQPIYLERYRRTEPVINFSSWLLLWALIAFSSIILFGRSIIIGRTGLPSLDISAAFQAVFAVAAIILVGSPLLFIYKAIKKAKVEELVVLEEVSQSLHEQLYEGLETPTDNSLPFTEERSAELKSVNELMQIITSRMKTVEDIPSLPIHLPALFRVASGVVITLGTSYLKTQLL